MEIAQKQPLPEEGVNGAAREQQGRHNSELEGMLVETMLAAKAMALAPQNGGGVNERAWWLLAEALGKSREKLFVVAMEKAYLLIDAVNADLSLSSQAKARINGTLSNAGMDELPGMLDGIVDELAQLGIVKKGRFAAMPK